MTVRQIKHRIVRELLHAARARIDGEGARPSQTALRRAVSDSYYAVFHAVCYLTADGLVGWNTPWESFEPIYRSLDHQDAKKRFATPEVAGLGAEVRRIGEILRDLIKERHTADYDPRPFATNKPETLARIAQAQEAIDLIEALPKATYRKLAVLLIAKPRRS